MAGEALDDTGEKPLDPAAERVRRKLVRFMAINLAILFAAVMAVVLAVVYRSVTASGPETPPLSDVPGEPIAGAIPLPAGARIVSQSLSGDRLAIDTELSGGGRAIFIYDLRARRVVGRFDVTPQ